MSRSLEAVNRTARVLVPLSLLLLVAIGGWVSWEPLVEILVGRPAVATEPRAAREPPGLQTASGRSSARFAGAIGAVPTVADVAESVPAAGETRPSRFSPAIDDAGSPSPSATGARSIEIARRPVVSEVSPLLARGYAALQRGDTHGARAAYDELLRSDPRSRDARLGLAAIAMRRGERDEATGQYLDVLRVNPRDSVAQAALISLHETLDPVAGESRIKLLLNREPSAAYLHFGLGNLYAGQSRWREAQASFFNAYRLDGENPDYAYNLAVSLDRLAQKRTALEYYRLALALAERHYASFDPGVVLDRIQTMVAGGIVP